LRALTFMMDVLFFDFGVRKRRASSKLAQYKNNYSAALCCHAPT
jgi:hypothetical protein